MLNLPTDAQYQFAEVEVGVGKFSHNCIVLNKHSTVFA